MNALVNFVEIARQHRADIARIIRLVPGDAFHIRAEPLAEAPPGSGEKTFSKDIRLVGAGSNGPHGVTLGGSKGYTAIHTGGIRQADRRMQVEFELLGQLLRFASQSLRRLGFLGTGNTLQHF